jgi:hypothetical protein
MTKTESNDFRRILETRQTELQNANQTQPITVEAASDDLDRIQQTPNATMPLAVLSATSAGCAK